MLDLEFAQLTHPGRLRQENEDSLGHAAPVNAAEARTHGWLFALADGVGGHDRGEVASRGAIDILLAGFRKAPAGEPHAALMQRLVQSANTHVFDTGMTAGARGRSMATTLVACALRYDRAVVAHVGDSRCYLIRGGRASTLTRDHTVVNDQVRLGLITSREAQEAENRHILSRSVGSNLFVDVDVSETQIQPGDVLALCSDGLHGAIADAELAGVISEAADLSAAAGELVNLANERDGSDNISVQLIRIRAVERVGMYRGRPYKLP